MEANKSEIWNLCPDCLEKKDKVEIQLSQQFERREGVHWNPYSVTAKDFMLERIMELEYHLKQEGVEP
jgi:hypothetical protein